MLKTHKLNFIINNKMNFEDDQKYFMQEPMGGWNKKWCPGTKGGSCKYQNGFCKKCGKEEITITQEPIGNFINQEPMGGWNEEWCPRTMGGSCHYVNVDEQMKCEMCGRLKN
jgi:hypothetical protein